MKTLYINFGLSHTPRPLHMKLLEYTRIKTMTQNQFTMALNSNALMVLACRCDCPMILEMQLSNPKNYIEYNKRSSCNYNVVENSSLLCLACVYKSYNCIKYLIDTFDVVLVYLETVTQNWFYKPALEVLMEKSHTYSDANGIDIKILTFMINEKYSLIRSGYLLNLACVRNKVHCVRYLLNNYGNDISMRDIHDTFRILLNHAINPATRGLIDRDIYTLIIKRWFEYNATYNKLTINQYISFTYNELKYQMTLLHVACFCGSAELVKFLVEHGADIQSMTIQQYCKSEFDIRFTTRQTPLFIACRNRHMELTVQLLKFAVKDKSIGKLILNNVLYTWNSSDRYPIKKIWKYYSIFSAAEKQKDKEMIHFLLDAIWRVYPILLKDSIQETFVAQWVKYLWKR